MTLLPKVKLKSIVSFPATILDGAGVDVVRQNGSYQFNIAFEDFAPPVAGISDAPHQNVLLWNNITNSYVLAPISVVGSGGAVTEAPNDGVQYGRQSLTWAPIVSGAPSNATPIVNGIAVPGSSTLYSRDDHVHPTDTSRAPLASPTFIGTPSAPTASVGTNSTQIASTAFVIANSVASGAITEAPNDGTQYARQSLGWSAVTAGSTVSPATATPLVESGAGAVGTSVKYAREDHVHSGCSRRKRALVPARRVRLTITLRRSISQPAS